MSSSKERIAIQSTFGKLFILFGSISAISIFPFLAYHEHITMTKNTISMFITTSLIGLIFILVGLWLLRSNDKNDISKLGALQKTISVTAISDNNLNSSLYNPQDWKLALPKFQVSTESKIPGIKAHKLITSGRDEQLSTKSKPLDVPSHIHDTPHSNRTFKSKVDPNTTPGLNHLELMLALANLQQLRLKNEEKSKKGNYHGPEHENNEMNPYLMFNNTKLNPFVDNSFFRNHNLNDVIVQAKYEEKYDRKFDDNYYELSSGYTVDSFGGSSKGFYYL